MELLELMRTRHSIRSYTDAPVAPEDIEKILQAGLLSESGKAIRPWEFILVENPDTLQKLTESRKGGVKMLREAKCAIVVLGDEEKSDVWTEDCAVALHNMHLMAHSLGLGSCWVQGRLRVAQDDRSTESYTRDILGYPENMKLLGMLAVGHPNEEKPACELSDLLTAKIHKEKY